MRTEPHNRNISFPESFGGAGVKPFGPRVRIVGGGLTGILAAFQAHRMGARDIELYERLDQLGGVALPDMRDGHEMREGCIYFGPQGDPIRDLLEKHGVQFEEFENRFGSVSSGPDGLTYTQDFGGPALAASNAGLTPVSGVSLADRLGCYNEDISAPLNRYVKWHAGCDAADLHANAAIPLAINRIFPVGPSLDALSQAKRTDELANELFGIPRSLWGYTSNAQASLPLGGFAQMFRQCREALYSIGVRVYDRHLATPKTMLSEETSEDILVWAASPMPLFKAVGIDAPRAPTRKFAVHTFAAHWSGPVPFYVQNFTAQGSCFRVYIYESEGSTLLTAECVSQADEGEIEQDIHRMLEGFDGALSIGECLYRSVKPRWLYHSVDTIDRLAELRSALKSRRGDLFVTGAWETYAKAEKFVEVEANLNKAFASNMAVKGL